MLWVPVPSCPGGGGGCLECSGPGAGGLDSGTVACSNRAGKPSTWGQRIASTQSPLPPRTRYLREERVSSRFSGSSGRADRAPGRATVPSRASPGGSRRYASTWLATTGFWLTIGRSTSRQGPALWWEASARQSPSRDTSASRYRCLSATDEGRRQASSRDRRGESALNPSAVRWLLMGCRV